MELFAQRVEVSWIELDKKRRSQEVILKPAFLQNGTGSCILSALEAALPHLTLARIKASLISE